METSKLKGRAMPHTLKLKGRALLQRISCAPRTAKPADHAADPTRPQISKPKQLARLPHTPRASKVYSKIDTLPEGFSDAPLTSGCLVLEGGAFRGLYSAGVIDALMLNNINMQCTVGTSAGALYGFCYTSAMLGSARYNLTYRHDARYVGPRALMKNQGIIGWDFVYGRIFLQTAEERQRFYNDSRRFVAVATNIDTGCAEYLEKGDVQHRPCADIIAAVCASASMPFVSKPVWVGAHQYLDGGCACKIPYQWALDEGYEKIIVIRTREPEYRKPTPKKTARSARLAYGRTHPQFAKVFAQSDFAYNKQCEEIEALKCAGRICVIAPSEKVQVERMEPDVEKLGALYQLGLADAQAMMPQIKEYLGK